MTFLSLFSEFLERANRTPLDLAGMRRAAAWASRVWENVDILTDGDAGARSFVERYLVAFPPETTLKLIDRLEAAERRLMELTRQLYGESPGD